MGHQGLLHHPYQGDPQIYNKHMIFPSAGVDLSNVEDFASIGMTVTGMPALNAITSVVAARPES